MQALEYSSEQDGVLVLMTLICWGGIEKVFLSPGVPPSYTLFSAKPYHFRGLGEQGYGEGRDLCDVLDAWHMIGAENTFVEPT